MVNMTIVGIVVIICFSMHWILVKKFQDYVKTQNKLVAEDKIFLSKIKDKRLKKYISFCLKYNLWDLETAKRLIKYRYREKDYIRLEEFIMKLLTREIKGE